MRRVASRGFYIPYPSESAVVRAGEAPPGATVRRVKESWLRTVWNSLRRPVATPGLEAPETPTPSRSSQPLLPRQYRRI